MKTIEINNKKYELPQSWEDCTLKQAIKVSEFEQQEDEYKVLALIAGYSSIDLQELKKMRIDEVRQIADIMKFMLEPLPEEPIMEFDLNGKHYKCMESFLNEQAQDYFTTESILSQYQHITYKALPELLAVMCKQEGESLDDFDLKERSKEFEDMPMPIANGLRVFFYTLEMSYQLSFLTFLNRDKVVEAQVNETLSSVKKLSGGAWSQRCMAWMLRKLITVLHKDWKHFSSGIQSTLSTTNSNKT